METVATLIGQIRKGELLLPEFQRGYVWTTDQVRELVRSMYRGHPTGHLLTWKTYRPGKTRGQAAASEGYSVLLLDGQQRLTSLYTLFEGEAPPFYEGERLFFNLYFNVRTADFRFWQKSLMHGDPSWVSVHEVLKGGLGAVFARMPSMTDEERNLFQAPETLERLNRLIELGRYGYTLDRLEDDDLTVEEVVDIFNRVNRAGTPLKKYDLALAHVCSIWPEAREEMRDFVASIGEVGFGVDLNFLIRSMAGVAARSVLLEGSFYQIPAEGLRLAWKTVRDAFEYLVNVLKHEAYIDHADDLASQYVLMPLTVFLARNGGRFADEAQKRAFLRWMHLASLWARYSGATETKLQQDVAVLDEPDAVQRLLDAIVHERGRLRLDARDVAGRGAGSSVYKLSYVVARARGARDWFTGTPLYAEAVGKANGLESHHVFPKAVLRRSLTDRDDRTQRRLVNEVGNRAFLTARANRTLAAKAPSEYLPQVEATYPDALRAQSVPLDRELWDTASYEMFLARRHHLLAAAINDFLDGLVSDEQPGGTSTEAVRELIGRGESRTLEFKSSLRWDVRQRTVNRALEKVVAKTVAGFLNSREGGVLLIGVGDDGAVLGLDDDYRTLRGADRDGFEVHLTQVLVAMLGASAPPFVSVAFHDVDGRDVCQLTSEPSDHPVYVTEKGAEPAFFLRTGNSTRELPAPEFAKYLASRWGRL